MAGSQNSPVSLESTTHYLTLVNRFIGSRQWDRVLETAKEWIGKNPENAQAQRATAQALVNLGRHAEAEPFIMTTLRLRPEDDFALYIASLINFKLKRFSVAEDMIQKAIEIKPRNSSHWQHLAWMCYSQGDPKSGLRWAEKALELSPRDTGAINMVAICQPKDEEGRATKRRLIGEALEITPDNPVLLNNLGIEHLNTPDFAAAEACFRRALTLDPTSKIYRKNLFISLKATDRIYKALCAPRDGILKFMAALRNKAKRTIVLLPIILLFWFGASRYVLAILVLWFILVWPMLKVYEYLTLADLSKKAGEIGANRGGFLGHRAWSPRIRLGLFTVILVSFWSAVALGFKAATQGEPVERYLVLCSLIAFFFAITAVMVRRRARFFRSPLHAWNRTRKFNKLMGNGA